VLGINGSEFIVLLVVAAVVLGPERLPQYAQQLARLVRELRRVSQGAQEKIRAEMGPEFDDVDWYKFDPRRYDPRRIVREALTESVDLDDFPGLRERSGRPSAHLLKGTGGLDEVRPSEAGLWIDKRTDGAAPVFDPDAT
jgi:sec-independent protein translocase protein TatB